MSLHNAWDMCLSIGFSFLVSWKERTDMLIHKYIKAKRCPDNLVLFQVNYHYVLQFKALIWIKCYAWDNTYMYIWYVHSKEKSNLLSIIVTQFDS